MNDTTIGCPKCLQPGILYSQRSITARIHIAHVLHPDENRTICMRTRWEFERIQKPKQTESLNES